MYITTSVALGGHKDRDAWRNLGLLCDASSLGSLRDGHPPLTSVILQHRRQKATPARATVPWQDSLLKATQDDCAPCHHQPWRYRTQPQAVAVTRSSGLTCGCKHNISVHGVIAYCAPNHPFVRALLALLPPSVTVYVPVSPSPWPPVCVCLAQSALAPLPFGYFYDGIPLSRRDPRTQSPPNRLPQPLGVEEGVISRVMLSLIFILHLCSLSTV